MAVASSDLVIYVAANMPEDNTSTAGGAIDSGVRASFDDPSSAVQLKVYSADAADTSQTLTVTGRNAGGSIVSEGISLNGTTEVTSSNTYERILKTYLSATAAGAVTVSGNGANKITDIPVGETGFRRPFYDATAQIGSSKTYYEKVFIKNNNATSTLNNATVIEVSSGLYSKIDFAREDSKQSSQTKSNRESLTTGVTGGFGVGPSGMVSDELTAGDYQGIWLKLSLGAGEAAANSYYEVQISGTTA